MLLSEPVVLLSEPEPVVLLSEPEVSVAVESEPVLVPVLVVPVVVVIMVVEPALSVVVIVVETSLVVVAAAPEPVMVVVILVVEPSLSVVVMVVASVVAPLVVLEPEPAPAPETPVVLASLPEAVELAVFDPELVELESEPELVEPASQLSTKSSISWILKEIRTRALGHSHTQHLLGIVIRAGLGGAVTDTVRVVLATAQAAHVTGGAAELRGLGVHVGDTHGLSRQY